MLEHIADFTAWPILTGILVGYIANRIMSGEGKGCCMNLPPNLKRGILSEDGVWNLLSDYREIQKKKQ